MAMGKTCIQLVCYSLKGYKVKLVIFAFFFVSALTLSLRVQGQVFFFGGSYAELCEEAALSIDSGGREAIFQVTGTGIPVNGITVCTYAINSYDGQTQNIPESYNNRGVLYFDFGNYDASLADFTNALTEKPMLSQAWINRAYVYSTKQEWQLALSDFQQGFNRFFPLETEILDLSQLEIEQLAASLKSRLGLHIERIFFSRAQVYEELGELRNAWLDYRRAALLAPEWEAPALELTRFTVK
jgi:tetratricopeptide (TPR) repeat protein